MKKTILTIMVAAMMLVAFTACEQQPNVWNPVGKTVEYVTIQSGDTEYLVGQPFDASRYTLAITYKDGTTGTENGNGILSVADNAEDTAGSKSVNVTIGNYNGTLNVTYYDIDKLTIEGAATTSVVQGTTDPDKIDLTGATVTAYYANSGKTMELAENEYKVMSVVASEVGADKGTVFVRYTGVAVADSDDVTTNAKYYANFTVDVTDKAEASGPAVSITGIALAKDVKVFYGDSSANKSNYVVTGQNKDGETVTLEDNEYSLYFASDVVGADGKFVKTGSVTPYVVLTSDPTKTFTSGSINVEDYIVDVQIVDGSNEKVAEITNVTRNAAPASAISSPNKIVVKYASKDAFETSAYTGSMYWSTPILNSKEASQEATLSVPTGKPSVNPVTTSVKFTFTVTG